jgi:hypothetical protein
MKTPSHTLLVAVMSVQKSGCMANCWAACKHISPAVGLYVDGSSRAPSSAWQPWPLPGSPAFTQHGTIVLQ